MRFQRAPEVAFEVLDGHAVIIDPGAVEMLTLNPVGTLVWQHLDDARTQDELVAAVLPLVTGVTEAQLAADVATFVQGLLDDGLVVGTDVP
jgi:hypothetical protein